jgi:DNA-binding response OmpR family regulator
METAAQNRFDVMVCDIGLPDGTGYHFIENVRKISGVPAIALSGFGMEEDIAQGVASGFDAHLTKPVNFQNLDAAIRRLTTVA